MSLLSFTYVTGYEFFKSWFRNFLKGTSARNINPEALYIFELNYGKK